jgi:capsular polysaccharide biosynthesis protein
MTPQRFSDVIKRRSLVVWSVIALGLGLLVAFRNAVPASFVGVSHVVLVGDSGSRDPSVSIIDLPSIATSTVVLERVRDALKLPMSLVELKADVSAAVLGRSSIMAITFRDQSSETAMGVANAVADELSRYYDEISTRRYDVNVDRLSNQLAVSATRIRAIQQQLGSAVARNPFVVSDQSVTALTTQLATLSAQRAEASAQLQGDEAIAATLAPSPGISKIARHEILAADPTYVAIRTIAARDSAELASQRAGYTSAFPGLPGAIARVRSEQRTADNVAAAALSDPAAFSPSEAGTSAQHVHQLAVVEGDRARVEQLDGLIASQSASLRDYPKADEAYLQLRSQLEGLQSEYIALANRRANALANRAEASSLGSVVVLDRAIKADTQLTGGRTRAAVISLVLILALAIGGAFLTESLDPRIRRIEEVEELYGIPVVARFGTRS